MRLLSWPRQGAAHNSVLCQILLVVPVPNEQPHERDPAMDNYQEPVRPHEKDPPSGQVC